MPNALNAKEMFTTSTPWTNSFQAFSDMAGKAMMGNCHTAYTMQSKHDELNIIHDALEDEYNRF